MAYQTAPQRNLTADVSGRLVYKKGSWGSNRPMRNWTDASLWAYSVPQNQSMPSPRYFLGNDDTDDDGRFKFTASAYAIPNNLPPFLFIQDAVEFRLEFTEVYTHQTHFIVLNNLVWGQKPQNNLQTIRLQWEPAITTLAQVGLNKFNDTRLFAMHLVNLIDLINKSPNPMSKGIFLTLLREPGDHGDFTTIQKALKKLSTGYPSSNYIKHILIELHKIGGSPLKNKLDNIIRWLIRLAHLNIAQLEKGAFLGSLHAAFSRALNQVKTVPVFETAPDAAAICVLLFVTAMMVKNNNAKPTVKLGEHFFSHMPMRKYHKIEVSFV